MTSTLTERNTVLVILSGIHMAATLGEPLFRRPSALFSAFIPR